MTCTWLQSRVYLISSFRKCRQKCHPSLLRDEAIAKCIHHRLVDYRKWVASSDTKSHLFNVVSRVPVTGTRSIIAPVVAVMGGSSLGLVTGCNHEHVCELSLYYIILHPNSEFHSMVPIVFLLKTATASSSPVLESDRSFISVIEYRHIGKILQHRLSARADCR